VQAKKKSDEYEERRGKLPLDNDDKEDEDNTYNRVMMSKMEMPLQRKENDKHKAEDDDVPEEINE
jgi:hypothetical protein